MDPQSFDRLAKTCIAGEPRRRFLRLVVSGAVAPVVARLGLTPAKAGDDGHTCRSKCSSCGRDSQCCSGRCTKGVCHCRERGKCSGDRECCSGRCRANGTCVPAHDLGCACRRDGTCHTGLASCGQGNCFCTAVAEGGSVCAQAGLCSENRPCTRTSDCPPSDVCVVTCCSQDGPGRCVRPCAAGRAADAGTTALGNEGRLHMG